jgi:arginine decarboxylase
MPQIRSEQAMTPREAFFSKTEDVKPSEAVGRVSAEWITPYPPGIPAVAAGEVYNQAAVEYLQELVEAGGFVEGTADPTLEKMRVVA